MNTAYFYYHLPKELIAQTPVRNRDESRLMVFNRKSGAILHKYFCNIIDFLESSDVLVINNTKVIPARIFSIDKRTREVLLIKEAEPLVWEGFIKPLSDYFSGIALCNMLSLKS